MGSLKAKDNKMPGIHTSRLLRKKQTGRVKAKGNKMRGIHIRLSAHLTPQNKQSSSKLNHNMLSKIGAINNNNHHLSTKINTTQDNGSRVHKHIISSNLSNTGNLTANIKQLRNLSN